MVLPVKSDKKWRKVQDRPVGILLGSLVILEHLDCPVDRDFLDCPAGPDFHHPAAE